MVQQLIHGTQYIDELVMVRVSNKGDLYVHQDANSNVMLDRLRRETDAMTVRSLHDKTATRQGQFGLILDSPSPGSRDCCGATCGPGPQRRVKDRLVERYTYTPYGELTVDQETSFGDYDGDADVDSTDQAAYGGGGDCAVPMFSGVTGACRILDLDFDGRILYNDTSLHNMLDWGFARHPGRTATSVSQPFAHQGLLHEPEIASYQNRARQYDPVKRRFTQRDPLEMGIDNRTLPNDTETLLRMGRAGRIDRFGSNGSVAGTARSSALGQLARMLRTPSPSDGPLDERWLSAVTGTNPYLYLESAPAERIDPSGLYVERCDVCTAQGCKACIVWNPPYPGVIVCRQCGEEEDPDHEPYCRKCQSNPYCEDIGALNCKCRYLPDDDGP